ncbi:MAG: exopolyphosphatase [Rhizobiaceae bacterium]
MNGASQGRLPNRQPVAIVDIGSNSIRMVVYEGNTRSPTVLFNEKMLAGLGRGVHSTGRLDPQATDAAIEEFKRFRALAEQTGAAAVHVIATAAAREAENGPQFIERVEEILGTEIEVLTGKQEATYSALGIISGFRSPDGIGGDLGGGSLELFDVHGQEIGDGITLPLGGLRLQDMAENDWSNVRKIARQELSRASWLKKGKNRVFYAVGGTWRNLARLHMNAENYPLGVMHHYVMRPKAISGFLEQVASGELDKIDGISSVSKNRRGLLPYGAIVLQEIIKAMRPSHIEISALGIREGYLYSLLDKQERTLDPLIVAAEELALLRSRSIEHAVELAEWTKVSLAKFGIEETADEARYRTASCMLADIGWRAHPEYRGKQSLNVISHTSFIGVDHPGRAYIALANAFRHDGLSAKVSPALSDVAGPRLIERAKITAGLMRFAYLLSAALPHVISRLSWQEGSDGVLELQLPQELAGLSGDRPSWRFEQLARLVDRPLRMTACN